MADNAGVVFELTASNVVSYLTDCEVLAPSADATVEELGWGISNLVLKVSSEEACMVIKQSLPKLRVESDWSFDRSRIAGEELCMRYLGGLLPSGWVPRVVHSDQENFIFGMTCAPPGGTLWKKELLEGQVELSAAAAAGKLLAYIHRRAANDDTAAALFADQTVLIQGRIEPYHLTAARVHPELASLIEAEVERLLSTRLTLVLGDYCPKNTFVYSDHLLILDFEVAHWGDPAFDIAFCLNHLILKAACFSRSADALLAAAHTFWNAYRDGMEEDGGRTEAAAVRELGCLLLARIDGKSKVEYIESEATKELVRRLAGAILLSDCRDLPRALRMVGSWLAGAECSHSRLSA